ncbi:MAG: type II toxin-antitoxin system Phd/YefM family antitoxin [Verrucomicrobia bacterium]|nr:type II toxin-antitoxin system Phd/YefM family antitoxin [Verrucomicrobiota bacterium]
MNSPPVALSRTVGSREAKARLAELLTWVERGHGEITITRHSRPVARLVPVDHSVFRRIRALRARLALAPGETAHDLINAGRRI